MKKIHGLLILLTFLMLPSFALFAQRSLGLGIEAGYLFYDLINDKNDVLGLYQGFGPQISFQVDASFKVDNNISVRYGLGYSYLKFMDLGVDISSSSYLKGVNGLLIKSWWDPMKFTVTLSYYLLASKNKRDSFEKRSFTNLDLGLMFDVNKSLSISLSSPFTIAPIFGGSGAYSLNGQDYTFIEFWTETIGLNVGVWYRL